MREGGREGGKEGWLKTSISTHMGCFLPPSSSFQGLVHEFADSQFGHLFAKGQNREAARKAMVLALKVRPPSLPPSLLVWPAGYRLRVELAEPGHSSTHPSLPPSLHPSLPSSFGYAHGHGPPLPSFPPSLPFSRNSPSGATSVPQWSIYPC